MICNYCGIREASIMAISMEPRCERPRLHLCLKCWNEKWSVARYVAQPIPLEPHLLIPPRPLAQRHHYSYSKPSYLRT